MTDAKRRLIALAHQTGAFCPDDDCKTCAHRVAKSQERAESNRLKDAWSVHNDLKRTMTSKPRG